MRRRSLLLACALVASPSLVRAAGKEKKKGGGLAYIQFPTMTATILRPNGRRGVMTVESGVDVPDAGLHTRAEQSQLLLRDAYVRWLIIYAASLAPQTQPNVDEIETELQRTTDHVLGRAGAKFLVGTVMIN